MTPTRSERGGLRAQLGTWINTGELESPSDWNKAIYELVRAVDSRRIGLDPYTFGRVFTPEQIKIEGTGPAQRAYFTIRREERSEEHTSELQSLMRISYAVFCLKKKQKKKHPS